MTSHRVPLWAALVTFLVHLVANPHYGFFRDELYFIVCGRHPAIGYVDQPPIVPLLAAGSQLFGHSLVALRAIAALFAAGSVYVTCVLAEELGGGSFAQALAAFACAASPVLCSFGMKLSTDTVGLVTWPLLGLFVLRLSRGADFRTWLIVGGLLGVSVLAKYSVLYYAFALLGALVLTPQRRILASRGFAAAVAIAVVIALPNFAWQLAHGLPMLELLRNGQHGKNVVLTPGAYLLAELVVTNPALAIVWLAGLVHLLAARSTRFVGVAFVLLIVMMIASHAKHYYPVDAYPVLFAAGGVAWERICRRTALRIVVAGVAVLASLPMLPYVLPILPTAMFIRYHAFAEARLGIGIARTENAPPTTLPQDWADMHGWPELAAAVAKAVDSLPPEERSRATIIAANYGEAAAIDFFGEKYHLPPASSGHNQYFLWGTRGRDGDVLIDVHGDCGADDHLFQKSERFSIVTDPLTMPWEQGTQIMICHGIGKPLAELWPAKKFYY